MVKFQTTVIVANLMDEAIRFTCVSSLQF